MGDVRGLGGGIPLEIKGFKMKILVPILSYFMNRKINGC